MPSSALRVLPLAVFAFALLAAPASALAQATSRPCAGTDGETPGPACLAAHLDLPAQPPSPVYWSIHAVSDPAAARKAADGGAAVVEAFGKTWLFGLGAAGASFPGAARVADIGPLPLDPPAADGHGAGAAFAAEFLKSTFSPGMTAPLHMHSGPEAFFALDGASCLETPDGAQVARGPNHALMIREGPPMLLKAIGDQPRRGFALILHPSGHPPTTLTQAWTPKGLCPAN